MPLLDIINTLESLLILSFLFSGEFDRGQPGSVRGSGWRGLPGRGHHRGPLLLDRDGLQADPLPRLSRALGKKGKFIFGVQIFSGNGEIFLFQLTHCCWDNAQNCLCLTVAAARSSKSFELDTNFGLPMTTNHGDERNGDKL